MKRHELEHILRASNAITGVDEIIVIGSHAVHACDAAAAPELTASVKADVFTFRSPDDAALIDGTIGEVSPFRRTIGYYAHGVGSEKAVLPDGWRSRLVPLKTPATGGATGLCLEVHDLAASKLIAGREKDLAFVAALRRRLADPVVVRDRLAATTLDAEHRRLCEQRLERAINQA